MELGEKIKRIREQKGMLQKQVAAELGIGYSNYNKIENGTREISAKELQKLAGIFEMDTNSVFDFEGGMPEEITVADKTEKEQLKLIGQLDEEDKQTVFRIIDRMLTTKKFKDFFQKNVANL